MKFKLFCGIIGVAIVIGGIVCFVQKSKKNDESENGHYKGENNNHEKKSDIAAYNTDSSNETSYLNLTKAEAVKKMTERHEEAQKTMKESVDNIFGDTIPTETKNKATKKKMFDDLDNI